MRNLILGLALLVVSTLVAFGQEPVKGTGTVNEMNNSPDQNQVWNGQRPIASEGGSAGLVPDYSDRVNGRAYPTAGNTGAAASSTKAAIAGNPGGIDQNSGAPMNDKAAIQAAKKGAAPNNSPEANPPKNRVRKLTPSPGSQAATRASTGGQSNETKESREQSKKP